MLACGFVISIKSRRPYIPMNPVCTTKEALEFWHRASKKEGRKKL
jgi:hypothetical protein